MESVYDNIIENCDGCLACQNICPVNAISKEKGLLEFLYPMIDQDKCINCQACKIICPLIKKSNNPELFNHETNTLYAVKHKDIEVLNNSTSGGVFSALSDFFINHDNVVYGVVFDNDFNVIHARATTRKQRDAMRFSKYVQTDLTDIYPLIKVDLDNNKKILFTGTPCQCAGIKHTFMKHKNYSNLFIVDLICHSIPSPQLWNDYKDLVEQENNGKLELIQFRSKVHPWLRNNSNKGFLYKINDTIHEDDRFYQVFTQNALLVRDSCYNCHFTNLNRVGDLTMADYWGIEDFDQSLYDPKGVSSVFINNDKGRLLFDLVQNRFHAVQRDISEQLATQGRLKFPTPKPENRDAFVKLYLKEGLAKAFESLK